MELLLLLLGLSMGHRRPQKVEHLPRGTLPHASDYISAEMICDSPRFSTSNLKKLARVITVFLFMGKIDMYNQIAHFRFIDELFLVREERTGNDLVGLIDKVDFMDPNIKIIFESK